MHRVMKLGGRQQLLWLHQFAAHVIGDSGITHRGSKHRRHQCFIDAGIIAGLMSHLDGQIDHEPGPAALFGWD